MSLRRRIPRTEGMSPTAVYGLTTAVSSLHGAGWASSARLQRFFGKEDSPSPAWMLLERNPERKLELACRGDELRRPETAGDVSDVVAELLRHRADKIAYGRWCHVQVIDLLHIHPVKQIEYLSANLSFNPLGERDHPLYPQAYVVVGVTQVGIARQVGHAVVEREPIPVQIPLRW